MKHVIVVGAPTKVDRELISQEVFIGERMARVDKRTVSASLKKFSWLNDAQVERNWIKSSITIKVKVRLPLAKFGKSFVDSEGVLFSLPHPERFAVPNILAASTQARRFAADLIESLPASFRKDVGVVSVEGMQSATLLIEKTAQKRKQEILVRWGDSSNTSLKVRVFQSLLALPENSTIVFMDLSAPHAPIVR
ncbi:MAG: FtsQ-type POTRA domain-containing protein [Actinobacteria bacterium]|nr:FtsQ-type POTRA domain-containing protein [Actinomycetota bacterium]